MKERQTGSWMNERKEKIENKEMEKSEKSLIFTVTMYSTVLYSTCIVSTIVSSKLCLLVLNRAQLYIFKHYCLLIKGGRGRS